MNIPYGRQQILDEDIQSVVDVLRSDFLTQGPAVANFENEFSKKVNAKYSLAMTNGTAALHLAAIVLGVRPGQKILCATNSFSASANCIRYCGADVEFLDINPSTFCVDENILIEKLENNKYKYAGVIVVDLAGYPVNMEKIRIECDKHNMWIIEDACHAVGGYFVDSLNNTVFCGSSKYSDITVFSFHPVKHIATGEGGMLTTNNKNLFEKLSLLRTHGITKDPAKLEKNDGGWYYEMQELGYNYRISDILCALGSSQLKRLDQNLQRRRQIAQRYFEDLKNLPISFQDKVEGHAYHLFPILTENRLKLYNDLREHGIYSQVHYIPIHTLPYYRKTYGNIKLKNAESVYSKTLSLPMYHSLSDDQQSFVIERLKKFFS